ncbi:hypothetical protein PINS_up000918 [Pythium insidiosum]|nr:hypothetical protein PINS_up000918 [Pythium insidiosum]
MHKPRILQLGTIATFCERVRLLHERIDWMMQVIDHVPAKERDAATRTWRRDYYRQRTAAIELVRNSTMDIRHVQQDVRRVRDAFEVLTILEYERQKWSGEPVAKTLDALCEIVLRQQSVVELPRSVPAWFVAEDDFDWEGSPLRERGVGAMGTVHLGQFGISNADVVVKRVDLYADENVTPMWRWSAVDAWWKVQHHPNIQRIFGACHVSRPALLLMEYALHGSIRDYFAVDPANRRRRLWHLVYDACCGLVHLHQHGIAHGNLKCENILIGEDERARITDFGYSIVARRKTPESDNSSIDNEVAPFATSWLAPELSAAGGRGEPMVPTMKSDVFAFALCILELVSKTGPKWKSEQFLARAMNNVRRPQGISDDAWKLIEEMCVRDPEMRPSMENVRLRLRQLAAREDEPTGYRDSMFGTMLSEPGHPIHDARASMVHLGSVDLDELCASEPRRESPTSVDIDNLRDDESTRPAVRSVDIDLLCASSTPVTEKFRTEYMDGPNQGDPFNNQTKVPPTPDLTAPLKKQLETLRQQIRVEERRLEQVLQERQRQEDPSCTPDVADEEGEGPPTGVEISASTPMSQLLRLLRWGTNDEQIRVVSVILDGPREHLLYELVRENGLETLVSILQHGHSSVFRRLTIDVLQAMVMINRVYIDALLERNVPRILLDIISNRNYPLEQRRAGQFFIVMATISSRVKSIFMRNEVVERLITVLLHAQLPLLDKKFRQSCESSKTLLPSIEKFLSTLADHKLAASEKAMSLCDRASALQRLTEAICLDPKKGTLFAKRSTVYVSLRKYEHAARDALQCIKRLPEFGGGYFCHAIALFGMQQPQQAKRALRQGQRYDPQYFTTERLTQLETFANQRQRQQ